MQLNLETAFIKLRNIYIHLNRNKFKSFEFRITKHCTKVKFNRKQKIELYFDIVSRFRFKHTRQKQQLSVSFIALLPTF